MTVRFTMPFINLHREQELDLVVLEDPETQVYKSTFLYKPTTDSGASSNTTYLPPDDAPDDAWLWEGEVREKKSFRNRNLFPEK